MGWFLAKSLGLPNYLWGVLGFAALAGVWLYFQKLETADDLSNQVIGANTAVIAGQETTLEQVENANAAGNEVRNDANNARYVECLRSVAEGFASNCERYRTHESVSCGSANPCPTSP